MITALSLVNAFYNFSIENDTENILKANHNTLEYSRNILLSLGEMNIGKQKEIAEVCQIKKGFTVFIL